MKTWLLVAAERREFAGLLKRTGVASKLEWPGAKFAQEAMWKGDRWWMIANGPGARLVKQAVSKEILTGVGRGKVSGIISTGLCGALDPALRIGDIVVDGGAVSPRAFVSGTMHSSDHVVITSREKQILRNQTGAAAVDMETGTLRELAAEYKIPFGCVRVVSDTAGEDMPLDFNRYQDANGDFSRIRIALAAMARPFTVMPRLMEFDRDCRRAAEVLGEFLADCQF